MRPVCWQNLPNSGSPLFWPVFAVTTQILY
jgi:hypothetical protein